MPTPVSSARQCLTQEAASALDEAVAVAKRRGHAQTTSLHMVSSLLSLPNSSLREACTRTRNNAYSTRVQFKALELSLSVSLDRLPSSQASKAEEPPVSNSLMAAIKRSQANQRRQPENFSFYQQQQQYSSCSSPPIVKVELQNLILSILDDPLVSRVLGEAGFRSYDIKMATLRPGNSFHAHHLFGYTSRYKRPNPPLFLCNFSSSDSNSDVGSKSFSFPFMGCFSWDENSRRIGEAMVRNKKRSPLLLGVSAGDALRNFLEVVQRKIEGVLPVGLGGLSVVCVKDEILRFVNGDCDEGSLDLRFEEVERMVESGGVVVNLGDLKALAGETVGIDGLRYLVGKLARLLEIHRRKLWLIGSAATYELYFKFLNKFPSIEEDWDLEILPITSVRFSMGGSYPRSSLMESFVPLGGFFSMPSDTKTPFSNNTSQHVARCHLCNEKYEQEVTALSNGGVSSSIADRCNSNLPSWLQTAEPSAQSGLASVKAKDDRLLLTAKIAGLQKKWDSICSHHHQNQAFSYTQQIPRIMGFQVPADDRKKETSNNSSRHSIASSSTEEGNKNAVSSLSTDSRPDFSLNELRSLNMLSKPNNPSTLSKSHHFDSSSVSINDGHTSPTSITSVTTDLGLGLGSPSTRRERINPVSLSDAGGLAHNSHSQSSSCRYPNDSNNNLQNPKFLFKALVERVNRQEAAISSLVKAISQRSTRHGTHRRDIWINFRGADKLGKKKLGVALAEVLKGSAENLLYADLTFHEETMYIDTLFDRQVTNRYDITMRGTYIDYLVEKIAKKPSVIFFENLDKADPVVQSNLSRALKTGRLTDLSGREVSTSNCIFLASTSLKKNCSREDPVLYSEEDVIRAKGCLFQILIRFDLNDIEAVNEEGPSDRVLMMNKRKLIESLEETKRAHKSLKSFLDLNNLPDEGEPDSDSSSENTRSWLEDFDTEIDRVVDFEPFDFDSLADKLSKEMSECLHEIVGSRCSLEIERTVMQQLLAAAYVFDNKRVEDWIRNVLRKGFLEAVGKFGINARSVVKVVTCEGDLSEEKHEGLLPPRIIVN